MKRAVKIVLLVLAAAWVIQIIWVVAKDPGDIDDELRAMGY